MGSELDLRDLTLNRAPSPLDKRIQCRGWLSRYIFPGLLLVGFSALLGWAVRDKVLPKKAVTVVPVIASRAEVQLAGAPLFQAAGWIEPRPTAVLVSALAEGIVETLLVVEGQSVEAGQPVAKLIDADAKLSLEQSENNAELATAEVMSAEAELSAAQLRLENPVHLQALLSEADSLLAKIETELARLPFLIEAAETRSQFTQQDLAGKREAGLAVSGRSVQQARREHKIAQTEVEELSARRPGLEQERAALRKRSSALQRQLELLIDENRQVATAVAQVKAAKSRQQQAELMVKAAQLRVNRMVVTSPMTGRVLALVARPGSRVMGLDPGGEYRASTILSMYDPQVLQVRADVRLEDVPLIQLGQLVRIETPSVKGVMEGKVINLTSQANIQKNTLEAKVAIMSPPSTVRPEMLVTTTFLATEQPERDLKQAESSVRLMVPRQLVEPTSGGHLLWLVDSQGIVHHRAVRLGSAGTDVLVEVIEGITITDRMISAGRESLKDGDRVDVTGEDGQFGIASTLSNR